MFRIKQTIETKSIEEIEYEKIKTRENKEEVKFKIGGEILTYSEVVDQIKERDIARLEEIARESGKETLKDYSVSPSGKVSEETQLESNRLAVEVNNKAIEAEPRITEDLKTLESESTYLKGLEHKLKSQDSLSRKILSDSKTEGITLYASCNLFFADFHPIPSVIQTNSNPGTALIFGAISE